MPHTPKLSVETSPDAYRSVFPDLAELCRMHDVSLDLIERCHDVDELLERVLEEYESRLRDLPTEALDPRHPTLSLPAAKKLRALVMFAAQAVALVERSREVEVRHRIDRLGEVLRTLSVLSHKINNPLTSLLGRAQLLQALGGADPKVVKAAAVILESAGRIADLVRELALVVREGKQEALEELLSMESETGATEPGS